MSCRGTFTAKVEPNPYKHLLGLFVFVILALFGITTLSSSAFAASGITYTGRIVKDDAPLDSGIVRFDVWIKSKDNCVLYYERRNIDMAGSGGTYSFEIGDANIIPGSQSFPQTGIQTISAIFDNSKSRANGDVDTSLPCTTFNPADDEGRLMTVSFTPAGETAQALPDLAITAVPTAFQAFNANKVDGYGTGDLLKVDPTVTKTTYANGALTQAQYDEFWKLILGTSTTYLKAIPTLGGDVSGTLPAVTVTKIQNVAVTAPATGDTGKVLTYNGTGMVWQSAAAGGITSINGLSGSTQSFAVGTSGTDVAISSAGSTHTINVPSASASNRGALTAADWSAFNAKQSSSLANGKVWIGNATGGAEAQTLSGDATVSASGNVTVDKTQTAQASKILQLDSSGNAYVNGVDIKGSGAVSASIRYSGASNMVMNLPTTSGSANQFLQTDGAGNLSWASQSAMLPTISAGQVWVGNASGGAQAFTLSGDVASVSNTGAVTLSTSATGSNKLPLAGGTMSGAINMGGQNISNAGDVSLAAGKFFGLGAGSTAGTVAGQIWYDSGVIKYFDGTTAKSLGVAGAGITNLNGLSAGTQSFVVGSAGNSPAITSAGSAHTLDIPMASASGSVTAGLISNADYVSMMAKQSNTLAAGQVWVGNASGVSQARALSGDIFSVSNVGLVTVNKTTTAQSNYILALDGSGVGNMAGVGLVNGGTVTLQASGASSTYSLKLPAASPLNNQILKSNATGDLSWVTYLAQVSDSAPLANGKMWIGNASGIASEVAMSGDATIDNAGLLTLKNTGTVGTYSKVVTDAQGRVVSGSALASGDVTTALGYTPVNKAGDSMSGDLITQNINIAAGKFLGLGSGSTAGTVAGQIWYDSGVIKYFDGTTAKSLGVAGAGITNLNGLSAGTQSFVVGTAGTDFAVSSAGSAHTFNLPSASATNRGALTSADWTTFNAKQGNALTAASVWVGNSSGGAEARALSGDVTIDNVGLVTLKNTGTVGTYFKVITDAQGRVTSGAALASGDVTTALGYTPASSSNGYVNGGNTFAGNATIGLNDAYNLGIKTNNATRLTITSDGKVGIGTTTPNTALAVATGDITLDSGYSLMFGTSAYSFINGDSGGSSHLVFGTSGANVMYIDVNGNVGIGASPSSYTLDMGSRTNSIRLPIGTTAQRPGNAAGQIRYNTSTNSVEFNDGSGWNSIAASAGSMTNTLAAGQMWVGNASGVAQAFALSGDVASVSNTGLVTAKKTSVGAASTLVATDAFGVVNGYGFTVQGSVAGSVGILAASSTSNYTIKLPATTPVANQIMQSDASGNLSWINTPSFALPSIAAGKIWVGNSSGGPEAFSLSGDIASVSNTGLVTLKNTGTVGTYWKVITDAQGRVTSGSALASGDVTTALGYIPASANAGYVNGGNTFAGNATIGLNDAYTLGFETNNATRMTITAAGNVGIGTATPLMPLHVNGGAIIGTNNTTFTDVFNFVIGNSNSITNSGGGNASQMMVVGSSNAISTNLSGFSYNLDLFGRGNTVTNAGNAIVLGSNNTTTATNTITIGGNITNSVSGSLQIGALDTAKITILSGGNVGINNTNPTAALDVSSSTGAVRLPIGTTAQRPSNATGLIRYNSSNSNVEFNDGSTWTAFGTGSGSLPSIAAGQIWVGNASGAAQAFSLSGDVSSVSNTGLVTINKTTTGTNNTILSLDGSGVATAKGFALVNTGTVTVSAATSSSTYGLKLPAASPAANQIMQSDASGNLSWINTPSASLPSISAGKIWVGNSSGGPEAFSLSGDIASVSNTGLVTLKNTGTVGTYWKVITDAQGRVTSGSALASGDVTTALGYMPANGSLGYINGGNTFAGNATIGLNDAFTLSFKTNNTTQMTLDASGKLGIGTTTINNNLSFSGQAAQKIGVERTTTAATAGSNLTMTAGGAYSGGTNLAGGSLILSSGTSTGNGGSDIQFQVASAGTSGTTDRAPATKVTISGTTNSDAMAVSGSIRGTSYNAGSSTTIDWSRGNTQYTTGGCTGTQYTFSNMRDGGVYTLAITGTFSATCTFGQTSPDTLSGTAGSGDFYFLPANSIPSGSNSIYSFMRVGNKVYVQWNSGFQN